MAIFLENTGKFSDKIVLQGEHVEKHIPIELKTAITEREISIMKLLSSKREFPLITKLLYVDNLSMDSHTILHISPNAEMDLFDACVKNEMIDIQRLKYCIILALKFVHMHNIIHMDVKPENILIKDGNFILCDFGLSVRVIENYEIYHTSPRGSHGYIHPEYIRTGMVNGRLGKTYDLYSLLVTIITCIEDNDDISEWLHFCEKHRNSYKIKSRLHDWIIKSAFIPDWIVDLIMSEKYLRLEYKDFVSKKHDSAKRQKIKP